MERYCHKIFKTLVDRGKLVNSKDSFENHQQKFVE